jgi:serine/threonine protein kinase
MQNERIDLLDLLDELRDLPADERQRRLKVLPLDQQARLGRWLVPSPDTNADNSDRLPPVATVAEPGEASHPPVQQSPGLLAEASGASAPGDPTGTLSNPLSKDGSEEMVGNFKLLQKIGEGGFGIVYMAEQQHPVRRRVALKIIKAGMDTRQVVARFEAERQALARMDHPNIARVLDAGATARGRPYFVMELVRGVPITEYCDQANVPTRERLELFILVCKAIQHAHQKGIIHRDIKPSNILITLHDGVPVPKVIDFGIAKAIDQPLTDKTLFTRFEQFIGTPAYMSPEQAELSGLDIDTRSDIYSLGVLLYELLTGRPPFDPKELQKAGLDEIRRTIREKDPPTPSRRLSTLAQADIATAAKQRGCEPGRLTGLIRGDLDWIVMKAMEKNRARRYDTANGVAMDIGRHLQNLPIEARSQSSIYRLQKMVRRNSVAVATAGAVVLALAVGLGVSTRLFFKERSAHQRALAAEQEEGRLYKEADTARANEASLRVAAEANEIKAQTEAARSAQVAQFMKNILQGVGPGVAKGLDTQLLRGILDQTAAQMRTSLKGQPLVEADLRMTLGKVYGDLGDWPDAEAMYHEAMRLRQQTLGEEAPDAAVAMNRFAQALDTEGKRADGIVAARQALAMNRKVLGSDSLAVADSLNILGSILRRNIGTATEKAESLPLLRESLAIRRKQPDSDPNGLASTLTYLGMALGGSDEAIADLREALDVRKKVLGDDDPGVANSLAHLGSALTQAHRYAEAETVQRQALAAQIKMLGPEHRDVMNSHRSLGNTLRELGKFAEAAGELQIVADMAERQPNWEKNSDTNDTLRILGLALDEEGKYAEAEAFYRDSLTKLQSALPLNAPQVSIMLTYLCGELKNEGKFDEARELVASNLEKIRAKFGPEDPATLNLFDLMGEELLREGKLADAEVQFRAAVDLLTKQPNWETQPRPVITINDLGQTLEKEGKLAEAQALYRQSLPRLKQAIAISNPNLAALAVHFSLVLFEQGKPDEAKALLEAYLGEMKSKLGPDNAITLDFMNSVAWDFYLGGRPIEGLALAESALAAQQKKLGPDDNSTLGTQDTVANIYEAIGRLDEATRAFEQIITKLKAAQNPDSGFTTTEMLCLGWVYQESGRLTDSQAMMEESLRMQRANSQTDNLDVAGALGVLGLTLVREEKFTEAEPVLRQSLALYEKLSPRDWERTYTQSVLGAALAGQKKYADAEPLLLAGYNGLKESQNLIPGNRAMRLDEARQRLAALYTDWGKPDKVAEWKASVAGAPNPAASTMPGTR